MCIEDENNYGDNMEDSQNEENYSYLTNGIRGLFIKRNIVKLNIIVIMIKKKPLLTK